MRKANQKAIDTTEARERIAGYLDQSPAEVAERWVKFHMTKAAQLAICGQYVGRMRFVFRVQANTLTWRASRALCFGTDFETVAEGKVLDDNLYVRRAGRNGPFLKDPTEV